MSDPRWDEFIENLHDVHYYTWRRKAQCNFYEWGDQMYEELLLAIQEELGELTQAYLEHNYEDGEKDRLQEELNDLTALLLQLQFKLDLEKGVLEG